MASARAATADSSAAPPPGFSTTEDLSRKYKLMDSNKKDWAAETEKELRRQKQELQQLRKDNDALKQQVALAQAASYGIARGTAPDDLPFGPLRALPGGCKKLRRWTLVRRC